MRRTLARSTAQATSVRTLLVYTVYRLEEDELVQEGWFETQEEAETVAEEAADDYETDTIVKDRWGEVVYRVDRL